MKKYNVIDVAVATAWVEAMEKSLHCIREFRDDIDESKKTHGREMRAWIMSAIDGFRSGDLQWGYHCCKKAASHHNSYYPAFKEEGKIDCLLYAMNCSGPERITRMLWILSNHWTV